MDPLTQGVLGASLPQAVNRGRYAASGGLLFAVYHKRKGTG